MIRFISRVRICVPIVLICVPIASRFPLRSGSPRGTSSVRTRGGDGVNRPLDLLSALEFLPFGVLVGVLVHWLALVRSRAGWMTSAISGACGALIAGLAGRSFGIWPEEGPQGFAISLLGALGFAVAFRLLSGSSARAVVPRFSVAPGPRSEREAKSETARTAAEAARPTD